MRVMTNRDSIIKSRDIALPTKVCLVKAMVFPVVVYGCESCGGKELGMAKVTEHTHTQIETTELILVHLIAIIDCEEIQPVYPKEDQSWVFIESTDIEAETPIFWPPDTKS